MKQWLSNRSGILMRILYVAVMTAFFWCNFGNSAVFEILRSAPALPEKLETLLGPELFWSLIVIQVFAVISLILRLLSERWQVINYILGVMALALFIYDFVEKVTVSKAGMVFSFYPIIYAVMVANRRFRQKGADRFYLWLTPFIALYLAVLMLIPASEDPYGWDWFFRFYDRAQQKMQDVTFHFISGGDHGLIYSGFSERQALFPSVRDQVRPVMNVQFTTYQSQRLYIAGTTYAKMQNLQWQPEGDLPKENMLDVLELLYAVKEAGKGHEDDYIHKSVCYMVCSPELEGYSFEPAKSFKRSLVKEEKNLKQYRLVYYRVNLKHDLFAERLTNPPTEVNEKLWEEARKNLGLTGNTSYNIEAFLKYREDIRTRYGTDPQISDDVRTWLKEVTAGAQSDYEKLCKIEEALSEFTYNKSPGKLPKNVETESDLLRYFLLESKEGYCTHFATAFTLLARAAGIPARYVQGFCLESDTGLQSVIYSNMAHAWSEAYIAGIGWVAFEPTPGYMGQYSTVWASEEEQKLDAESVALREEMERQQYEQAKQIREEAQKEQLKQQEEQAERERLEQLQKRELARRRARWILGYILMGSLTVSLVFLMIDRAGERRGRTRAKTGEAEAKKEFRVEVYRFLQIAEALDLKREETETLTEFDERLQRYLTKENLEPVDLLKRYEEVIYGGRVCGEEDREKIRQGRDILHLALAKKTGKKYYFYRVYLYLIRTRFF